MAQNTKPRAQSAGDGKADLRIEPPRRRVNPAQLILALVVVGLGALLALVAFSQAADRQPVLMVVAGVERGQVVGPEVLGVVFVAADEAILTVPHSDLDRMVGQVATTDLVPGRLLTPGDVAPEVPLGADERILGLTLAPGGYPTVQLRVGDLVDVVYVGSDPDTPAVLAAGVEVYDLVQVGVGDDLFISLRVPASAGADVARAAGDVRLLLSGDSG